MDLGSLPPMKAHDMDAADNSAGDSAKILQFPKVYSLPPTIEEGTIVSFKMEDGKIKLGIRLDSGRFLTEYYLLKDA